MSLAAEVEQRLAAVHRRVGEQVTLVRGAESRTVWAQVGVMSTSFRNARFPSPEYSGWDLPALAVRVAGHDPAIVGDTFTRDGRTFTVRQVEYARVSDAIVLTLLLCA
jgi:hypothetical protein